MLNIILFIVVLALGYNLLINSDKPSENNESFTLNKPLTKLPMPATSVISYPESYKGIARFVIKSGNNNFYVKLRDSFYDKDLLTMFIRHGEQLEVNVPLGNYDLYYATGTNWFGDKLHFGHRTVYKKSADSLQFYKTSNSIIGHIVTLHSRDIENNKMPTRNINRSEF